MMCVVRYVMYVVLCMFDVVYDVYDMVCVVGCGLCVV